MHVPAQLTAAAGKHTAVLLVRLQFTAVHLKWASNAVWRSWTTHSPTPLHEYFIASLSSGLHTSRPSSSQTGTLLPTVWRKSYPRKSTSSSSPLHLSSRTASVSMSFNLSLLFLQMDCLCRGQTTSRVLHGSLSWLLPDICPSCSLASFKILHGSYLFNET